MLFKIDENVPAEGAELFHDYDFDCATVEDEQLTGADDDRLVEVCKAEGRILVTLDLGFGNIRAYPPGDHPGFIVLRLQQQDKARVLGVLSRVVGTLTDRALDRQLWVVTEDALRVRG